MRFVTQIHSDHGGVAVESELTGTVPGRHGLPVSNPSGLTVAARVPQAAGLVAAAGLGTMIVQNNPQPDRSGVADERVEVGQCCLSDQGGVRRYTVGKTGAVGGLVLVAEGVVTDTGSDSGPLCPAASYAPIW